MTKLFLKKTVILTILVNSCFLPYIFNPTLLAASGELRVLSLRQLQKELERCKNQGNCSDDFLRFGGLNLILGYIVDEMNHDVMVVGRVDPAMPPLYTEDFIVALRHVWLKYAHQVANRYVYSSPTCSLDPAPAVTQNLQRIGELIVSQTRKEEIDKSMAEWHRLCQEPFSVRVLGVPFQSRFAKIMVNSDYDLKKLVVGSDSVGISDFKSLTEMKIDQIQNAILEDKPISVSLATMNRFWLSTGANLYYESEGMVLIQQCDVKLLTEEQYVSRTGVFQPSNRIDFLAKSFAENFTKRYDEIAAVRPIYAELKNLFRFVVLAKIIKYKSSHIQAGLDLTYFLDDFPLSTVEVEERLPGLGAIERFEYRKDLQTGYQLVSFWLPSCGGISIDVEMNPELFQYKEHPQNTLLAEKRRILKSRPSTNPIYWDYMHESDTLAINNIETVHKDSSKNTTSAETIDAIIEKLKSANIAFNSPESLEVGDSRSIILLVSLGLSIEDLKTKLDSLTSFESKKNLILGEEIKTTEEIEASLTGFGFTIKPITRVRQLVRGKGYSRWEWVVKGDIPGKEILYLTINVIIDYKDERTIQTLQTFRREILVYVKPQTVLFNWVGKNIPWIAACASSVLTLSLGYYLALLKERRNQNKTQKPKIIRP